MQPGSLKSAFQLSQWSPQALDLSAWHLLDTALNHLPASYITELTKVWLIYGLVLPEPGCRACLDESLSQSQVTEQGN